MEHFPLAQDGSAVSPVDPDDLKRVWFLSSSARAKLPSEGALGISQQLYAQECSAGADVMAVWMRSSLLWVLIRQGVLSESALGDAEFAAVATFPIPAGVNNIDFPELAARVIK